MAPVSLTAIFRSVKNARPRVFVAAGPVNPWNTSTGCSDVAASSSAERRQALLRELRRVPSAHRGDEPSGRDGLRARLDRRLHLGNRRRRLERRVIAGPDPEQDDVIVVVDEAGNDGAAAQIDFARAGAEPLPAARADGGEPAVLNRDLADRGPARVHRDDPAVGQSQIAGARARIDWRAASDRDSVASEEQRWRRIQRQCRAGLALQTRRNVRRRIMTVDCKGRKKKARSES